MNWITRRTYSIYKIRNCISILTLSTPIPTFFHSFSAFPHLYPFSPNTSWNVCSDINTGYHQLGPVYLYSLKILESSSSWFAYPLFGNFVWVWLKSWTCWIRTCAGAQQLASHSCEAALSDWSKILQTVGIYSKLNTLFRYEI